MNRQRSAAAMRSAIAREAVRARISSAASASHRNSASWRSSWPSTSSPPASHATSAHAVASCKQARRLIERGLAQQRLIAVIQSGELRADDEDRDRRRCRPMSAAGSAATARRSARTRRPAPRRRRAAACGETARRAAGSPPGPRTSEIAGRRAAAPVASPRNPRAGQPAAVSASPVPLPVSTLTAPQASLRSVGSIRVQRVSRAVARTSPAAGGRKKAGIQIWRFSQDFTSARRPARSLLRAQAAEPPASCDGIVF